MMLWHLELISGDGLSQVFEFRGEHPPRSYTLPLKNPLQVYLDDRFGQISNKTRTYRLVKVVGPSLFSRHATIARYEEIIT